MLDKRKVVIIGAGHVGSHCAMALCFQGTCDEIVFIDIDHEKAISNCYDVACGVPCIIGRNGIEDIIELPLTDSEKEQLEYACRVIKETIERIAKI